MNKLHEAVLSGDFAIVKKVFSSSFLSGRNEIGQTPFHTACSEGNIEIVTFLLKRKPNLDEQDNNGWTPLHCAANSRSPKYIELCSSLIQAGANLNVETNEGSGPFQYLVRYVPAENESKEYIELLRLALSKGVSIFTPNKQGEYPQHFACLKKNMVAARFLFENGALPDLKNEKGETALTYAVIGGSAEIAKYLLDIGANKYIFNVDDETPQSIAKKMDNKELNEVLADIKLPALHTSIRNRKTTSVNIFVKSAQNVNTPDKSGMTPLHHACTLPDNEITAILLGAPVEGFTVDNSGNTIWHYLAATGQCTKNPKNKLESIDLFKKLAAKGGLTVIDKLNSRGESPLHLACEHGNNNLVHFLIENKAQVNFCNIHGQSPLHFAIISRQIEITTSLLNAGAENRSFSKDNDTSPLDLAKILGNSDIVALFSGKDTLNQKQLKKQEKELQAKEEKERKMKEKKEKQEKHKEEKAKKKEKDVLIEISQPSEVRHSVHVGTDYKWVGDPAEIFEFEEKVGEGAFGSVYKAVHKDSRFAIAIKILPAGDSPEDIEQEINILKDCKHPNIVSYFGSSVRDHQLWVMMEFCGAGSAADLIKHLNSEGKNMTEDQVGAITIMVLKGLSYLHSQVPVIIHRDLKPANILLNGAGEAKIADFGVSAQLNQTLQKAQTTIGTPIYMSPEVIDGSKYDTKFDLWSLGISMIEMAQGKLPFHDCNIMRAIGLIVNGPPPTVDEPKKFTQDFNSFVSECLTKDPTKRKSANELLAQPFIFKKMGNDNKKILRDLLKKFHDNLEALDSSEPTRVGLPIQNSLSSSAPQNSTQNEVISPSTPGEPSRKSYRASVRSPTSSQKIDQASQIDFLKSRIQELEKQLNEAKETIKKQQKEIERLNASKK